MNYLTTYLHDFKLKKQRTFTKAFSPIFIIKDKHAYK